MKINIKATGIILSDSIRDYVYKKISSVEKYFKDSESVVAQVEVGKTTNHHKSGEVFMAEVKLVGAGQNIFVVEEAEDLYSAIDLVENELSRKIISTKGRHIRLLRQGERAMKYMMKGIVDTTSAGLNRIKFFKNKPK